MNTHATRRTVALILAAALMTHAAPAGAAGAIVKVPVGTTVILELQEAISSETASQGQKVRLEVMSDVKVKGKTVIRKGSTAVGEVASVSKAGMAGTAGGLGVTLQTVEAVDGSPILISMGKGAKGEDKMVKSIAIAALCCVFALLMKGKDVTMEKGTVFTAMTLAPAEVTTE